MTARKLCAASVTACIAAFIVLFPAAMLHSPVMALCAAAVALATAITSAVTFVSAVTHPCRVPAAASGYGKSQAICRYAGQFLDEHPDSEIVIADGKDAESTETAPDTRIYRIELSRSTSGQWSLRQDGELIARSRDQGMGPSAAQEWAEATLQRRELEWLNGRFDPDPKSGYWVADPQDETAATS